MNYKQYYQSHIALKHARQALRRGKKTEARHYILEALELTPEYEDAWIMMAEISDIQAKMVYINKAFEINPSSQKARQAVHDIVQIQRGKCDETAFVQQKKLKTDELKSKTSRKIIESKLHKNRNISTLFNVALKIGISIFPVFLLVGSFLLWTAFSNNQIVLARAPAVASPSNALVSITKTPSPTTTSTSPTPTQTSTVSPTTLPATAESMMITSTQDAEILQPSQVKNVLLYTEIPQSAALLPSTSLPPGVNPDERWIDINLSSQQLYAFFGNEVIRTFIVSTGMSYTPTPTGVFHIYVKYPSADMFGPGYYLPGVPSVMYFNKDYGIHGAYWHMNFGTPMSHGCVNMTLEDAAWLFEWSSVGTAVNIHY